LIELIGKILYSEREDNQNFKRAAQRLFPKDSINPVTSDDEYETVITALWAGLRWGVSHKGFMQAERDEHIDVQITEDDSAPSLAFSRDPDRVVEVGGKQFVDAVICELRL
jgi:hypothetical protein